MRVLKIKDKTVSLVVWEDTDITISNLNTDQVILLTQSQFKEVRRAYDEEQKKKYKGTVLDLG